MTSVCMNMTSVGTIMTSVDTYMTSVDTYVTSVGTYMTTFVTYLTSFDTYMTSVGTYTIDPQRSIIGPYAWRLCRDEFLNDARCELSSDTVEWVAYADDIEIAVKGNSRFELERLSERCLSHLLSFCGRYKLCLSTPKTKCLLIKSHMDRSRMPRVLCAGKRIKCVRHYKYLSVILESVPNILERSGHERRFLPTCSP